MKHNKYMAQSYFNRYLSEYNEYNYSQHFSQLHPPYWIRACCIAFWEGYIGCSNKIGGKQSYMAESFLNLHFGCFFFFNEYIIFHEGYMQCNAVIWILKNVDYCAQMKWITVMIIVWLCVVYFCIFFLIR